MKSNTKTAERMERAKILLSTCGMLIITTDYTPVMGVDQ